MESSHMFDVCKRGTQVETPTRAAAQNTTCLHFLSSVLPGCDRWQSITFIFFAQVPSMPPKYKNLTNDERKAVLWFLQARENQNCGDKDNYSTFCRYQRKSSSLPWRNSRMPTNLFIYSFTDFIIYNFKTF